MAHLQTKGLPYVKVTSEFSNSKRNWTCWVKYYGHWNRTGWRIRYWCKTKTRHFINRNWNCDTFHDKNEDGFTGGILGLSLSFCSISLSLSLSLSSVYSHFQLPTIAAVILYHYWAVPIHNTHSGHHHHMKLYWILYTQMLCYLKYNKRDLMVWIVYLDV